MAFILRLRNNNRVSFNRPIVMGIVNITPDSFFSGSRTLSSSVSQLAFTDQAAQALYQRVSDMVLQGVDMIDVGAYSTRPGAAEVSDQEELARLEWALPVIHQAIRDAHLKESLSSTNPLLLSVDTFRWSVAQACVEQLGVDIINDVSGGTADAHMLPGVVELQVPYVMMHIYPTEMKLEYPQGVYEGVKAFFIQQLDQLVSLGMDASLLTEKIMLDPGFGFAKNLDENYELFNDLPRFKNDFAGYPLFVGISRKSMIYKYLGTDAEHALLGTSILNTLALQAGADILRVHDVADARQVVSLVQKVKGLPFNDDACRP